MLAATADALPLLLLVCFPLLFLQLLPLCRCELGFGTMVLCIAVLQSAIRRVLLCHAICWRAVWRLRFSRHAGRAGPGSSYAWHQRCLSCPSRCSMTDKELCVGWERSSRWPLADVAFPLCRACQDCKGARLAFTGFHRISNKRHIQYRSTSMNAVSQQASTHMHAHGD